MFRPTTFVEHQSYRNILKELKWTRLIHLTSAGTGNKIKYEYSCFVEVFPFFLSTQINSGSLFLAN